MQSLLSNWRAVATAAAAAAASTSQASCKSSEASSPVFDPEAFERTAKAIREIDASKNATKAYEVLLQQEASKQAELGAEAAKAATQTAAYEAQHEAVKQEEQRKTLQFQYQAQAELDEKKKEWEMQKTQADHELNRQRNAELVKMQDDSKARQEAERYRVEQMIQAERRATEAHRVEQDMRIQQARAAAEAEGKIKERRANKDIYREELLLKAGEDLKKWVQVVEVATTNIGAGIASVMDDRQRAATLVGGLAGCFVALYGSRALFRVAGKQADRWLGTPTLIKETSRWSLLNPWSWSARNPTLSSFAAMDRSLADVILSPPLKDRIKALSFAAANTFSHGAPFRHMMFHGPPGTGKTLVAKRLARTSGLDFAIMSGGDVAPLGGGAVTQLHAVFDWAATSRKGLMLFIDEADAFLGARSDDMSEGHRAALNALLYRTGDQSQDFMVVLATNRPADLDDAVLDRMDEVIEFPVPTAAEREELLNLYLERYVWRSGKEDPSLSSRINAAARRRKATADPIVNAGVGPEHVKEAAAATEGFSAREMAKLVAGVQAHVYGHERTELTPAAWRVVVDTKVAEHAARRAMVAGR